MAALRNYLTKLQQSVGLNARSGVTQPNAVIQEEFYHNYGSYSRATRFLSLYGLPIQFDSFGMLANDIAEQTADVVLLNAIVVGAFNL